MWCRYVTFQKLIKTLCFLSTFYLPGSKSCKWKCKIFVIHNLIPFLYVLFFKVQRPSAGIVMESADVDNIDLTMFANLYKCLKQKVGFLVSNPRFSAVTLSVNSA